MADDWISISKAVEHSGYTADYLRTLIRQKQIKGRKVITVWLVSCKSLDGFVKHQDEREDKRGRPKGTVST
jgi:hypothetical protein